MAEINIGRTVFDKKQLKLALNTNFNEFFTPSPIITVEQFFIYYDELFTEISFDGNNSHEEIVQRSSDYLGIDPFEAERNQLLDQIADLEIQLAELEEPEHPIFKNGQFVAVEGAIRIYMMDLGVARHIQNMEVFRPLVKAQNPSMRKVSNEEFDASEFVIRLSPNVFDQIPKGPMYTLNDLSGKNKQTRKSPTSELLSKAISQASAALKTGKLKKPKSKVIKAPKKFVTRDSKENQMTKEMEAF